MTAVFRVQIPGPFTTVQDRGRFSYQHMGVPVSGAADGFAFRVANLLVGNFQDAAVLEITFTGPQLEVLTGADIALTGADMGLRINGEVFPMWRSVRVKSDDSITIGRARTGCRAYLAVTGGFDVPMVMGSRSTYVSGKIGGIEGRPLKTGDILPRGPGELLKKPRRLPWFLNYSNEVILRAISGPQEDYFRENLDFFFSTTFTVSAQANRMGYRLQGPIIQRDSGTPQSIISEPSIPGNIQIPADGQPIVLLIEQTTGGYAKIASVITPDLFKIAQAKPGDSIRFKRVTPEESHKVFRDWAEFMTDVEERIKGR